MVGKHWKFLFKSKALASRRCGSRKRTRRYLFVSLQPLKSILYVVGMIARDVIRTFPTNSFFKSPNGTCISPYKLRFTTCYTRRWTETIIWCSVCCLDPLSRHWVLSRHELHRSRFDFDRKRVVRSDKTRWVCILDHENVYWTPWSPNVVETRSPRVSCHAFLSSSNSCWRRLRLRVFQFERLVAFHLPAVYHHLKKIELKIDFFATQVCPKLSKSHLIDSSF